MYQNLSKMDILTKIKHMVTREGYIVRPDGKIELPIRQVAWDSPWVHSFQDNYNDCALWHNMAFTYFKFWPTHCLKCWKVVAAPKTLVGLFDLYEYQSSYGKPCKCGIEVRSTVPRLYGGYFYNHSKEDGLLCYKTVSDTLGHMNPILKVGCSEFEIALGPAEDWEVTDEQLEMEDFLKQWVVISNDRYLQPDHVKAHIMLKWIHHAFENGDETYKHFTNWAPLTVPMKTYHNEVKKDG